ncbi:MAG TPA: biotin carboxylase N-terminal domain-containing protein [Ktedonobacterales bacterium]
MTHTTTRPAPAQSRVTPSAHGIRKVVVANRGEIACRIMRTCRAMGIATVAVYSDADLRARHVREADEAIRIGPAPAGESYLSIPALLAAAQRTGADALHPGYGFLSERAELAIACCDAGITFIGPRPETISQMGSKSAARRLMAAAGVPVVPGYDGDAQSDAALTAAARRIGFPLLVKASAGGGGRGMRIVREPRELAEALMAARREAQAAFGDGTLLLEKLIAEPRHIEFQIFGDTQGNLIHLGERECSIQRRHQKLIEETPSPALDPELRAQMAEAALTVGRQLAYSNAGTVELILTPERQFYFLEVNTRLQVEHPVTELVTGLDLVRWQMLIAEGRPLPLRQDEVVWQGHAIEARLYAEDPASDFLPASGPVALWREPFGEGLRVDAGITSGDEVTIHYDPLLAKVSAHAPTRDEAIRQLDAALAHTTLLGVRSNGDYLRRVLTHPEHLAGRLSTAFLAAHDAELRRPAPVADGLADDWLAALIVALTRQQATPMPAAWRNNLNGPLRQSFSPLAFQPDTGYSAGTSPLAVDLTPEGPETYRAVMLDGVLAHEAHVVIVAQDGPDLTLVVDGHQMSVTALEVARHEWWVRARGQTTVLRWRSPLPAAEASMQSAGALTAPMPGQIIRVLVKEGDTVHAGDPLLVLGAMKMEHTIRAPHAGIVRLHYQTGDQVPAAAILLDVTPAG